jgi:hypothetical protein
MASSFFFEIHRAKVVKGALRQHELLALDGGRTIVLFSAIGLPRMWGYALDSATRGFLEGHARPHDGRPSTQLHQGLDGAQRYLRTRVEALIERRVPDVSLLAVCVEGTKLHVLSVGPSRLYVRHPTTTRRLTPKDERAEGILKAGPSWCAEQAERGDLLFGGAHTAFLDQAKDSVAKLMDARSTLEPQHVVSTLNAQAVAKGLGVAAFALRI